MAEKKTVVKFRAILPPIQSAISLDGNGDGARIKLDVPRSDVRAVLFLQQMYSNKVFTVIITDDE